jgi:hypothetical protein
MSTNEQRNRVLGAPRRRAQRPHSSACRVRLVMRQGGRARGPAAPRVEQLVEPGAHQEAEVLPAHRSQRVTDEPVAGVTPVGFVNSIRLQIRQICAGTECVHPVGFTNSIALEIGQIHAPDRIYEPYGRYTRIYRPRTNGEAERFIDAARRVGLRAQLSLQRCPCSSARGLLALVQQTPPAQLARGAAADQRVSHLCGQDS